MGNVIDLEEYKRSKDAQRGPSDHWDDALSYGMMIDRGMVIHKPADHVKAIQTDLERFPDLINQALKIINPDNQE